MQKAKLGTKGIGMKRFVSIICLLLASVSTSVGADTKNIRVDVGGVIIDVQAPVGFHEISSLSSETRERAEIFVVPGNRLLAVFVSEGDLGRIMIGEAPEFKQYMMLQVFRKLEYQRISNAQFEQLVAKTTGQQNTLLSKVEDKVDTVLEGAADRLSEEYEISLKMTVGEVVPLGVFFEQTNAMGFASLAKYQIATEGENLDHVIAGSTSFLLARDKVLFAYVYSRYESQENIDWVRSKSKEWVNSLLKSNKTATK